MRQEVLGELRLDREESALLDNHSLLNLFNVLEMQLALVSAQIPEAGLKRFAEFCLDVLVNLSRTGLQSQLPGMERNCGELRDVVEELLRKHPQVSELLAGVMEIISIGHARLEEFKGNRFSWGAIPHEVFRSTLHSFLRATERVSQERFRFAFPPGDPVSDAYWIDFRIEPPGDSLYSPVVLHDTIRDLVGNARKYSDPGVIRIDLQSEGEKGVRLGVSDNGYGIPEEEIDKVVHFGYRATNVMDRRTMGGGFGLTKAYHLCKKNSGRFFIESEIGKGTTIEMTLFDAI
ncbi:MAG TPA: ATP-binding protein [Oceanipulchritudo sp.]|nr:ATP-binding protein [Oceanipulchritudo sp.]